MIDYYLEWLGKVWRYFVESGGAMTVGGYIRPYEVWFDRNYGWDQYGGGQ